MTELIQDVPADYDITVPELRRYLAENASTEQTLHVVRSFAIFQRLGMLDDVEDAYLTLFMESNAETFDVTDLLERCLVVCGRYLWSIAKDLGITINPEITMYRLIDLIEAILQIEDFEDSVTLLDLLSEDSDRPAVLADLLALVDGQQAGEYLADLWDVDPSFFDRVYATHIANAEADESGEDLVATRLYRQRLREFSVFLKTSNLRTINLIRAGMPFGLPLATYQLRFRTIFTVLAGSNIAVEMYALTLISPDGGPNPLNALEPYIDTVAVDAAMATLIRTTLHSIHRQFQPTTAAPVIEED